MSEDRQDVVGYLAKEYINVHRELGCAPKWTYNSIENLLRHCYFSIKTLKKIKAIHGVSKDDFLFAVSAAAEEVGWVLTKIFKDIDHYNKVSKEVR